MKEENEIWKIINEYPDYEVSNLARVRNIETNVILKEHKQNRGYKMVNLKRNKISKGISLHRVVAIAFIPNPDNKAQVNHINGDKDNNSVANLEWMTSSENVRHAIKTGLKGILVGTQHGMSKLTTNDVLEIRRIYSKREMNQTKIAELFNIKQTTVSQIINKSRWAHI